MTSLNKLFSKKAGIGAVLLAAFATSGCSTLQNIPAYNGTKETNAVLGAGVGYGAGALLGGDEAALAGLIIGGVLGYGMSDPCESKTTTHVRREINGHGNGPYVGTQTYTETCRGKGKPGEQGLPSYTHTGNPNDQHQYNTNARVEAGDNTWTRPDMSVQYLTDPDLGISYPVVDQTIDRNTGMVYPVVRAEDGKLCIAAQSPHGGYNYYKVEPSGKNYKNTNNVPMNSCL